MHEGRNWYKRQKEDGLPDKKKRRHDTGNWGVLDTQLLCCGYPETTQDQEDKYELKGEAKGGFSTKDEKESCSRSEK